MKSGPRWLRVDSIWDLSVQVWEGIRQTPGTRRALVTMGSRAEKGVSRRTFIAGAGMLGAGALGVVLGEGGGAMGEVTANADVLRDARRRWVVGVDGERGMWYLGLDSEGTGREGTNLLSGPVTPAWGGADASNAQWRSGDGGAWICSIPSRDGKVVVTWTVSREGEDLVWRLTCEGEGNVEGLRMALPFNALLAATVLIPANLDDANRGVGPWLLVAPDFGHLAVEVESAVPWFAVNDGQRGGAPANAPKGGLDPRLRGQAWLDAAGVQGYRPGVLNLQLASAQALPAGPLAIIRFRPLELSTPKEIDAATWKRIRRPYLNHWQPCGTWAGPDHVMVLANNVLSDPASISLWFYSEPMLFCHCPVPEIDLLPLLRRSLDYWLDHAVSAQGHVNAFGKMYDLYVSTGACLLIAAWDYWTIARDSDWLKNRLPVLHRLADYLLRRDVDGDGLIESIGSGNAGTLRDPERADIWFEMMNFGHKNTWTNALAYRAFLCLAEMVEAGGHPRGAAYYRRQAKALREAYVRSFLSGEHGWFVSWISEDGEVHDYCHTFINGLAVAYGIVKPPEGREILSRVVAQSRAIGFDNWHLGVPGNLLPCRKGDMIGARIDMDGEPIRNDFHWPDDLTEDAAFGFRYPNGTIHPALVWPYLLGLQVAGLDEEASRILDAMIGAGEEGLFQNGIVNTGYGGAEHFYINGRTCGYEGFLPESFNFLMAAFTKDPSLRARLLGPMA
jgi:Bacterial alpha-L-rhamnosidase 6 hairpin glycosidase domain